MTREEAARFAALSQIAGMIRDLRLSHMATLARARAETLARLADLERADLPEGVDPISAAQAVLRYGHWADRRRREILPVLEEQTAALEAAEAVAREALGRADVLEKLGQRKQPGGAKR
jgi:DNA-binding MarR family transcriptional regulator